VVPPEDDLAGRLLVSTPVLDDPHFARSVVLVIEHGAGGTLGVILNRPTSTPLSAVLPAWAPYAATPATLFTGGPVSPEAAICLGRDGVVDLGADPAGEIRVFAGYAGWSAKQLEYEMGLGAWWVVPACADDLMTAQPESLWRSVLRRAGGPVARFAHFPDDVRLN
jgi:putative transcriptional regulator